MAQAILNGDDLSSMIEQVVESLLRLP